jgi:hypothetical protein
MRRSTSFSGGAEASVPASRKVTSRRPGSAMPCLHHEGGRLERVSERQDTIRGDLDVEEISLPSGI